MSKWSMNCIYKALVYTSFQFEALLHRTHSHTQIHTALISLYSITGYIMLFLYCRHSHTNGCFQGTVGFIILPKDIQYMYRGGQEPMTF